MHRLRLKGQPPVSTAETLPEQISLGTAQNGRTRIQDREPLTAPFLAASTCGVRAALWMSVVLFTSALPIVTLP